MQLNSYESWCILGSLTFSILFSCDLSQIPVHPWDGKITWCTVLDHRPMCWAVHWALHVTSNPDFPELKTEGSVGLYQNFPAGGGSWGKLQPGWLQDNESSLPLPPTPCSLHFIICWPSNDQRISCRWSFQYPWLGLVPFLFYNLTQVTNWPIRISLLSTV